MSNKPLTLFGQFVGNQGKIWGMRVVTLNPDVAYMQADKVHVHTVGKRHFVADLKDRQHDTYGTTNEDAFYLWHNGL